MRTTGVGPRPFLPVQVGQEAGLQAGLAADPPLCLLKSSRPRAEGEAPEAWRTIASRGPSLRGRGACGFQVPGEAPPVESQVGRVGKASKGAAGDAVAHGEEIHGTPGPAHLQSIDIFLIKAVSGIQAPLRRSRRASKGISRPG